MYFIPPSSTVVVSNYFSCGHVLSYFGRAPHLGSHQCPNVPSVPQAFLGHGTWVQGQAFASSLEKHFLCQSLKDNRETEAQLLTML